MNKGIIFAGGCFWGVQEYFSRLKGVELTKCLYIDGNTRNPRYEDLKNKVATHAEAVLIKYNNEIISLDNLLKHFLYIVDPFSINKQGEDEGIQYRSAIYYQSMSEKEYITDYLKKYFSHKFNDVKIELKKRNQFYLAENYHQDYLKKNSSGYCHVSFDTISDDEKRNYK